MRKYAYISNTSPFVLRIGPFQLEVASFRSIGLQIGRYAWLFTWCIESDWRTLKEKLTPDVLQ